MNYWEKRDEMIEHAKKHNEYILENFKEEIETCIEQTEIITEDNAERLIHAYKKREVCSSGICSSVHSSQTVMDAISSLKKGTDVDTVVLNFASFKHPGGAYMAGSSAQEESLCHGSILYPILYHFDKTFYANNRKDTNLGMYYTRMLYTPGVIFFCGKNGKKIKRVDVITCAAPNAGIATTKWNIPEQVVEEAMLSRIIAICELISQKGKKIAILGAFGCGVFKNNPETTGQQFGEVLSKYPEFKTIHPIPDSKTRDPFTAAYSKIMFAHHFMFSPTDFSKTVAINIDVNDNSVTAMNEDNRVEIGSF